LTKKDSFGRSAFDLDLAAARRGARFFSFKTQTADEKSPAV
jgi:hypothetical protein